MKRLALLGAAIVPTAVVVAVVSTRSHGSSAAAAVARAAQKAFDSGSSRVEITLSSGSHSFRVEGLMDYRRHRGRLKYGDSGSEAIYDGDVTYWRWQGVQNWLPKAKPWLRMSDGQDDPFDTQARSLRDPAALLGFLRSVSSGVSRIGRETLDGVATTRYDGTLDLEKIVQAAPAERRAELQDELDLLADQLPTTVPFSIWVDERGVARRVRYEEQGDESTTIDFRDFGVPVVLDIPPAEEVMTDEEFSALMEAYFQEHPNGGGDCGSSSGQSESAGKGGVIVLCAALSDEGTK